MDTQNRIVAAARGWVGTRFHHQGRLKKTSHHKGGCDCLGLLAGVAQELGLKKIIDGQEQLLASFDTTTYSHTPDGEALQAGLAQLLQPIPFTDISPGDIALFRIDHNPQHLAIISDYRSGSLCGPAEGGHLLSRNRSHGVGMIHAYAPARSVVEHFMDAVWREKMVALYRFQNAMRNLRPVK